MAREPAKKRKPRKPAGKPDGKGGRRAQYHNPREQFIYSPRYIPVKELARLWKGHKGCTYGALKNRCMRENWVERRKRYQERIEKEARARFEEREADQRAREIEEATRRHVEAGKQLQQHGQMFNRLAAMRALGTTTVECKVCKNKVTVPVLKDETIRATDAGRTASRMYKDGFDMERKALGFADQFVIHQRTEEIRREVVLVLERYVTDPDVFENIVRDLEAIGEKDREAVEAVFREVVPGKGEQ